MHVSTTRLVFFFKNTSLLSEFNLLRETEQNFKKAIRVIFTHLFDVSPCPQKLSRGF